MHSRRDSYDVRTATCFTIAGQVAADTYLPFLQAASACNLSPEIDRSKAAWMRAVTIAIVAISLDLCPNLGGLWASNRLMSAIAKYVRTHFDERFIHDFWTSMKNNPEREAYQGQNLALVCSIEIMQNLKDGSPLTDEEARLGLRIVGIPAVRAVRQLSSTWY